MCSQTSLRASICRKAAPQSCVIESFNNVPLSHFRGVAAAAEILRPDWMKFRNKIQLHSATTEKKKKQVWLHLFGYGYARGVSASSLQTGRLLSITSANSQRQLPAFILFKDLSCLKSSLYPEYWQQSASTVTNRCPSKAKTKTHHFKGRLYSKSCGLIFFS